MYNSKQLSGATYRKDSQGKGFYRAEAREDEINDEIKYFSTRRQGILVDKKMS